MTLQQTKLETTTTGAAQDAAEDLTFSADMLEKAAITTDFLKSMSHPARLVLLCRLAEGPSNVTEMEAMLNLPQAEVSKQLARLRSAGLVSTKRDGRNITYSLKEERTGRIVRTLHAEFCI